MATNPNNLGPKVSTRSIDWLSMAMRAWGSEYHAPDHGIYEFGSNRKFDSTDNGVTGLYGIDAPEIILLDGTQYPDMRDGFIDSFGVWINGYANNGLGDYKEVAIDGGGNNGYLAGTVNSGLGGAVQIPVYSNQANPVWGQVAVSPANTTFGDVAGARAMAANPATGQVCVNTQTVLWSSQNWGRTWLATARTSSTDFSMAYANGWFCTGQNGGVGAQRSNDGGKTWSGTFIIGAGFQGDVWSANNRFFYQRPNTTAMYWSDNATVWNLVSCPTRSGGTSVGAYGNGRIVALACHNSENTMYSTDNGLTWNNGGVCPGTFWQDITFANGVFCALIANLSAVYSTTSTDGVTWTTPSLTPANNGTGYAGITVYRGNFLLTDFNTGNVWWSPDGLNWVKYGSQSPGLGFFSYLENNYIVSDGGENVVAVIAVNGSGFFTGVAYTIPP
jgi:hypothetical protein